MADTKNVSKLSAKFVACPYDDNGDMKFEIEAIAHDAEPYLWIKSGENWIRIFPKEWPHLKAAIEEAIEFLGGRP